MDVKQKIIAIAQNAIIHYIKQNYSDKNNIDQELKRIANIFEGLDISFVNKALGITASGINHGEGKISLIFDDKDNISENELYEAIDTLIHEIYHSISKAGSLGVLEEGYVTYITAETIKYAIDNPIEIPGIDSEEIKELLKKQVSIGVYENASEMVRSVQLVLEQYGVDSKYEYIFNGIGRLTEIAQKINPELGEILELQKRKNAMCPRLRIEEKFFQKAFETVDFSNISQTLVEKNRLLQEYLIKSGEITRNKILYDSLKKIKKWDIKFQDFYLQVKDLPEEEILKILYEQLPQDGIEYQMHESNVQTIRTIQDFINTYNKSNSLIKPSGFKNSNFYAILIAYDIIQKGIAEPTEEDVMKYCEVFLSDLSDKKRTVSKVQWYISYVKKGCAEGKNLQQLLNECLANNIILAVNMKKNSESDLPISEKIDRATEFMMQQSFENKEYFYDYYYDMLFETIEKNFDANCFCSEEDYDKFVNQVQRNFDKIQMPPILEELGYTPEMMVIKVISDNLDMTSEKFPQQITNLLKIINTRNPNLRRCMGKLENFAFYICKAYEILEKSGDKEKITEFSQNLMIAYIGQGKDSMFRMATYWGDQGESLNNEYIEKTVGSIIKDPTFYQDIDALKVMFDKYPTIYYHLMEDNRFFGMLVEQLPSKIQKQIWDDVRNKEFGPTIIEINRAVIGHYFPKVENFTAEKFDGISPIVQFVVKYHKYQKLLRQNKNEEAQKLFPNQPNIENIGDDKVLKPETIYNMARKLDVQLCQEGAMKAMENVTGKEIKMQDIYTQNIS